MNILKSNGRCGRLHYFLTALVSGIIFNIANFTIMYWLGAKLYIYIVCMHIMMVCLWITICVGAKRCHDLGHNGWWQLIPFYGLWMLFCKGEREDNEYGSAL